MKMVFWIFTAAGLLLSPALAASQSVRLYAGKYNDRGGAGFQIIDLDPQGGGFRIVAEADAGPNPSYFCLAPARNLIYAINEVDEFHGRKAGGITTLAIDPATGAVRKVGELAVPNGGPCYISQTPEGRYLLVANYGGGSLAVVRLDDQGLPAVVTDSLVFQGPPGSTPRAHMAVAGPDGQRIYVSDLGLDRMVVYELDRAMGKLQALPHGETALARGAGPRHFAFSRDGSTLYVINERNSTLTVFAVAASGRLDEIQTISTLPAGFSGTNYCADLHPGQSGEFLYGTNRGHNSIVTFRVGHKGRLTLAGHTPCGGDWPRNFTIDPSGRYLVVANQRSNNLSLFALDQKSGLPRALPATCTTQAPACLQFAPPAGPAAQADVTVTDLRTEYKRDPLGIDIRAPRLIWKLSARGRGVLQSGYQIRVAADPGALEKGAPLLWDSGRISSPASIHIPYAGAPLTSGLRCFWQVRIWDQQGRPSPWSPVACWEMGLLEKSDWRASWIAPDLPEDPTRSMPCPLLRRDFTLKTGIVAARAYVTAQGLYEMELNGSRVGDELLTPGWTAYDRRIQYQTFDVTGLLKPGANAAGVTLGDGWYRGNLAFNGQRNTYGNQLALLAQIHVRYADGSSEWIGTDAAWRCASGPILASDIYNGETLDSRLERKGWSTAGFDAGDWSAVRVVEPPAAALVAPAGPPVRRISEITPQRLFTTPRGELVADFGQIFTGWVRLRTSGPAGQHIRLTHFEVLDPEGNVYLDNLREARQCDEIILDGRGEQVWEPHFTFHGFRYLRLEGFPEPLSLSQLTGIVIHSDYAATGSFSCSDSLIDRLQHNIQWSQKGNFVDVPTDCPQRNERLGWTGDAQVFARTACFNGDIAAFYTKWLKDLALDQKPSGAVPHVIPNVLDKDNPVASVAAAAWADAAVIVPWTVYLCYDDLRLLEEQYPSMKAWVDYMQRRAGASGLWHQDFTFGDWLAFATNLSDYPGATTDKDLVCQAYFIHSTALTEKTARLLGKTAEADRLAEVRQKATAAFQREFVTANGRLAANTQTAYCLALAFDLLPPAQRAEAARRLAEDVRRFGHITTGFVGTPLICPVLSSQGYTDEAFMLLTRTAYPSWLYPVTRGATTIWERWDGIKPDGSFQDPGMNSFNHYAYGAIGDWLYRFVAGLEIDPAQPGYKHILFQPHPGGGLTRASARTLSPYGAVACGWEIKAGRMTLALTVPPNTTARAILPRATPGAVSEGLRPLAKGEGILAIEAREGATAVDLGSGEYELAWDWPQP